MWLNRIDNRFFRLKVVFLTLLCGLILSGCNRSQQGPPPHRVPEVAVFTVKPQRVVLTTELPGRTSAFRIAEIRPQVSGLLLKRFFEEGSDVDVGQILYQIDPAPFKAALDNAKAALAKAEANLPPVQLRAERYKKLLKDKAVSQQDYDDADAALRQAQAEIKYWKAQVETARINLGYTRITAPISGRISRSYVTEGAIVTAYQPTPLATIQQLDPIYVDVPQSTNALLQLKRRIREGRIKYGGPAHTRVKLILEDGSTYPLEGKLQFQEVKVDPTTGSVIIRIIFPNPQGVLLPGMFVRAVIKEGVNEQGILIPQQAVSRTLKGAPFALVVNAERKVVLRMLTLDRAIGDKWLVTSGLAPGDRVIVEGLQFARPGMVVKTVPYNPKKSIGGPPPGAHNPSGKKHKGGA